MKTLGYQQNLNMKQERQQLSRQVLVSDCDHLYQSQAGRDVCRYISSAFVFPAQIKFNMTIICTLFRSTDKRDRLVVWTMFIL
jgi:hypothetical protein